IVELSFATRAGGDVIEQAVARLLETFPSVGESINLSPGGYVRRFYELKEGWYLSHITKRDLRLRKVDIPSDSDANSQIREFEAAFHRNHASADWYASVRHKKASVILEFDLDSIADTYECQSPVFVDGNWILDRDRLAGQID